MHMRQSVRTINDFSNIIKGDSDMFIAEEGVIYKDDDVFLVILGTDSGEEDIKTAEFLALCLNQRERDHE